jgi:hypothetical protein
MKESSEPVTTAFRECPAVGIAAALGCPVEQSSTGFASLIMHTVSVLASALREIFDESAYARFLDRTKLASSREAYAAFCRECEMAKARRPRCC